MVKFEGTLYLSNLPTKNEIYYVLNLPKTPPRQPNKVETYKEEK